MFNIVVFLFLGVLAQMCAVHATPELGDATLVREFALPKSPSGMFYDSPSAVLYVLCGTATNQAHTLYAYAVDGTQLCEITIPEAAGMSRVDGFHVTDDGARAYIVDSQGPIYASDAGRLGGSLYEVEWPTGGGPCACTAGACTSVTAEWSPTVLRTVTLDGAALGDGGGNDDYFRNSGVVVLDGADAAFAINGVHPSPDLTSAYPKSLVKLSLDDAAGATPLASWPFTGSTIGHDVDMEGLTCGADACAEYMYIGDEYNYVYRLTLAESSSADAVEIEWDLNSIVGAVPADKGIESISYNKESNEFYVGIQETSMIHVVQLGDPLSRSTSAASMSTCDAPVVACAAPVREPTRVRRELRTLSDAEWQRVVDAMWVLKSTSMEEGQAAYGAHFKPYDYFVVRHALAMTDSRGDQAHHNSHFMTWHAAFNLEFELALLAVDPLVGALPYWDQTLASPDVFTDAYLGSADTSDADERQLLTGVFGSWPIPKATVIDEFADHIDDASTHTYVASPNGWLRAETNNLDTSFVTRLGASGATYDADGFFACNDKSLAFGDHFWCVERGYHSGPHGAIGGKTNTLNGDFEDVATSPNDPLFFFHHANMERSMQLYMIAAQEKRCNAWDYAESTTTNYYGIGLTDTISSGWGFSSLDLGFNTVDGAPDALWTNADVLCWLNPSSAGYTYDTVVACESEPSLCVSTATATTAPTDPEERPEMVGAEGVCVGEADDMGRACPPEPQMGMCPPGCEFVASSTTAVDASTTTEAVAGESTTGTGETEVESVDSSATHLFAAANCIFVVALIGAMV